MGILMTLGAAAMTAQNSLPAPGSGGSYNPAPSWPRNGIGWNPGPGSRLENPRAQVRRDWS